MEIRWYHDVGDVLRLKYLLFGKIEEHNLSHKCDWCHTCGAHIQCEKISEISRLAERNTWANLSFVGKGWASPSKKASQKIKNPDELEWLNLWQLLLEQWTTSSTVSAQIHPKSLTSAGQILSSEPHPTTLPSPSKPFYRYHWEKMSFAISLSRVSSSLRSTLPSHTPQCVCVLTHVVHSIVVLHLLSHFGNICQLECSEAVKRVHDNLWDVCCTNTKVLEATIAHLHPLKVLR